MSIVSISWLALAAVHLSPSLVVVRPRLAERLYGVATDGDLGVLLVHRGAMFAGIVALCVWAAFDPCARQPASIAVALSVIGFLMVYGRAGWPTGSLRRIAFADAAALLPLAIVLHDAFPVAR